jgi:hypothetical protein
LQCGPGMMRENQTTLRRVTTTVAACAISAALTAGSALAEKAVFARDASGSPEAREAVTLCLDAATVSNEEQRDAMLERGLATAERAVAANDKDAKAHFGIFCNLGRKLESEGASLAGVANVKRLRAEIDRTLALQPTFVDAMTAKGAFLVKLPSLLGGDEDEGERLIRRAVELAPNHPPARLELAKALAEKGDKDEALAEARNVLTIADIRGAGREASERSGLSRHWSSGSACWSRWVRAPSRPATRRCPRATFPRCCAPGSGRRSRSCCAPARSTAAPSARSVASRS